MKQSFFLSAGWLAFASIPAIAASCESLASVPLPDVTVTMSAEVAAGAPAPGGRGGGSGLPAFCRVALTFKPTSDSDVKIEVWLPSAAGWNRKFQAVGNGGWGGALSYPAMAEALRRGYATSSTDTGHATGGASFALGHPEKIVDFAWRSEHEMTVKAKALIAAYYGDSPRLSYWNGCSGGGRQGLMEAQRFPGDFDGIVAGAPAINFTGRAIQSVWVAQAVHKEGSALPPDKFSLLHNAVLAACDAQDGVKDGVLEDPRRCQFDPGVLACKGDDASSCLTAPQVEAARKIYSAAINPRTQAAIFPGHKPGSELGWNTMASPQPFAIGQEHFKYVVFQNPAWDYKTFDFDRDTALTAKVDGGLINSLNPDLSGYFAHAGKIIQYHGWSDPQISPETSVNYYTSVLEKMGGAAKVQDNYRLFMVPGMAHCGGGEGPNVFDSMTALEQWVEQKKAPDQIVASRMKDGKAERTRPLCPYPQVAKYNGTGSTDDATNFSCRVP